MNVRKIVEVLDRKFPQSLQEKYDNTGCQIVFPEEKITNILLSLDIDDGIISEAIEKNCNLIISHHPFFFNPVYKIISTEPKSEMIITIIENKISIYSAHTNLDKIYYYKLGEKLKLRLRSLLLEKGVDENNAPCGYGTISELDRPIRLKEFLFEVKNNLHLDFLLFSGDSDSLVSKIAILNGAGGSSIDIIIKNNDIDCILTGDIGYHHSKIALEYSIPVIDAGHYGTEKILIDFLKEELQDYLTNKCSSDGIKTFISEKEKNPFKLYR